MKKILLYLLMMVPLLTLGQPTGGIHSKHRVRVDYAPELTDLGGIQDDCFYIRRDKDYQTRLQWFDLRTGKAVSDRLFDDTPNSMFDHDACVVRDGKQYFILHRDGKLTSLPFQQVGPLVDGVAVARDTKGYCLIDAHGKVVMRGSVSKVGRLCCKRRCYYDPAKKRYGYLNEQNHIAIVPQYLKAGDFASNVALVETAAAKGSQRVMINVEGKRVAFDCQQYRLMTNFVGGYAVCCTPDGRWRAVNVKDKPLTFEVGGKRLSELHDPMGQPYLNGGKVDFLFSHQPEGEAKKTVFSMRQGRTYCNSVPPAEDALKGASVNRYNGGEEDALKNFAQSEAVVRSLRLVNDLRRTHPNATFYCFYHQDLVSTAAVSVGEQYGHYLTARNGSTLYIFDLDHSLDCPVVEVVQ